MYQCSTCWHFYSFGYIMCLTFPTIGQLLRSNGTPTKHVLRCILDQWKWFEDQNLISGRGDYLIQFFTYNVVFCWWEVDLAEARSLQTPSAKCQDSPLFPKGPKQKTVKKAQRQVEGAAASSQYLGITWALPPTCAPPLTQAHTLRNPLFDPLMHQRRRILSNRHWTKSELWHSPLCLTWRIDTHIKIHLYKETHHYKLNWHKSWKTAYIESF